MIKDRITQRQKDSNNKQWYKDKINHLISNPNSFVPVNYASDNTKSRMLANYRLFNDKVDKDDFKHVIKPYGDDVHAEMPADFKNRDILSGKLKAIHGIEMSRPFSHKIIAVNDEATSRREQEHFRRVQQFVVSEIMKPIEKAIRTRIAEETKGQPLNKEEQQQIEQQIQQELKAQTPDEVMQYMKRDHQDPAEAMMTQLFEYETKRLTLSDKFNKGFFHATISSREVFYVGLINKTPSVEVVNPLRFNCSMSPDTEYIEDGEYACYEWRLSPSQVISFFGDELTNTEIDTIYEITERTTSDEFVNFFDVDSIENNYVSAYHCTWKSLKKIGFLKYEEDGVVQETIVDENYTKQVDDIELKWEWIPEVHEGWRIGTDIYKVLQPLPNQYNDIYNLYDVKLPYHGMIYDNINAEAVSLLDRMKPWQYYYNIIMYKIELLMSSDKGKVLLMNMNLLPKDKNINLSTWMHYVTSLGFGFLDTSNRTIGDITNGVKEIDMSLMSDIAKYINLAEFIESKCGTIVGITKELEGQVDTSALVGNTTNNIAMASNIVKPYFNAHDKVKKNVITSLLELCRTAYSSEEAKKKLIFVLDDLSLELLNLDSMLIGSSTFGIFVSDSNEGLETKQSIQQLFQAALQNDKANLSDLIKIMKSTSLQETEEVLQIAEDRAQERAMEVEQIKSQSQIELLREQDKMDEKQHQRELEKINLKGEIDIQRQAMLSMGFNEDKDLDNDGTPDVIELYKAGKEVAIKEKQQKLAEDKLSLEKIKAENANKLAEKKLAIDKMKAKKKSN